MPIYLFTRLIPDLAALIFDERLGQFILYLLDIVVKKNEESCRNIEKTNRTEEMLERCSEESKTKG